MIQFKDLSFGEWKESYNGDFKYRTSQKAGTKFMSFEVTEYVSKEKHTYELKWRSYAFQMEEEYGNNTAYDLQDENDVNEAIAKEVYGRIEWLNEESKKFLAL